MKIMRRKLIRLVLFILLMAIVLNCFASCRENKGNTVMPAEMVDIVSNSASDYVIVYDIKDAIGNYITETLWTLIWENCGVSLVKRNDSADYDYEIVVGNVARDGISEIKGKITGEDDFVIHQDGKRLYLYAGGAEGAKRMLITLRDVFLSVSENGSFSVERGLLYLNSQQSANVSDGSIVSLFNSSGTDYRIVYSSKNEDDERLAYYLRSCMEVSFDCEVAIGTDRGSKVQYEIQIGSSNVARDEFKSVYAALFGENDFAVSVVDEKVVLAGNSAEALLLAVEYFCVNYITPKQGTLIEAKEYCQSLNADAFTVSYDRLSVLYKEALNRYPTIYAYNLTHEISRDARRDQLMVETMLERMGDCYVLSEGKSSFLYDGYIRKLNREDYSRSVTLVGDQIVVPSSFANEYFQTSYAADEMVLLSALAETKGYTIYHDFQRNLIFMIPPNSSSFENDGETVGDYTVAQLKDRMMAFFDNPAMPEPSNNTEQSRIVIEDAVQYYPENSLDSSAPTYICYYSPSILTVMQADGSTVLYSSNERCSVKGGAEPTSKTVIHKSVDGGKTWDLIFTLNEVKWASLFMAEERVYIIGLHSLTGGANGDVVIGEVVEGKSMEMHSLWTKVVIGVIEPLVVDGYLYLPLDFGVASVNISTDITHVENWTVTQAPSKLITKSWFTATSGKSLDKSGSMLCQEGNIVRGRDGAIYVIYRVECQPHGNYAAMLKLSEDRTQLVLLPNGESLLNLPTTVSRFTIKFDSQSNRYICISNWYLTDNACRARNVLGISYSENLTDWVLVDTLLVDREIINTECSCWKTAFQYVDWDFDGDDIVMTVREATGFTNTFHDGKYYTFYRVSNFRDQFDFEIEGFGYKSSSNGEEITYESGTPLT